MQTENPDERRDSPGECPDGDPDPELTAWLAERPIREQIGGPLPMDLAWPPMSPTAAADTPTGGLD